MAESRAFGGPDFLTILPSPGAQFRGTSAESVETVHALGPELPSDLRSDLRETARRSPLFDAKTFATDLEHLLRQFCS